MKNVKFKTQSEKLKLKTQNYRTGNFIHSFWLAIILILLFCAATQAEHYEGRECSECHLEHNNEEYKLLKQEVINSGQIPCFVCHSSAREDTTAPNTEREFNTATSRHPLGTDKECLICHKIGKKHNDGNVDAWPDVELRDPDPQDSHVYTGAKINDFCLSCHDNSPVSLGEPPQAPIDLSSAYEFSGHGRIDINEPCTSCHEPHASMAKPHMIKDKIKDTVITGNDNSVCFACHTYSSDRYPGKNAYLTSEHGIRNKLCIDCHNPHGDNKDLCYLCHNDQYSTHYSSKRDKLCIDCHNPHEKGGLKMTKEDEEKLCFICHGEFEREFGNMRDGISGSFSHHKVDDEEYGGGKLECFDCHNPHTVTKMNIVSLPDDSGANMPPKAFPKDSYNYKIDIYDDFCLVCHDGSRTYAKDIRSELSSLSNLETEFSADRTSNLHKAHKDKGYGCQNCHNAHSSSGTSGIKRGALLSEEIRVDNFSEVDKYSAGKNSCSSSSLGLSCH